MKVVKIKPLSFIPLTSRQKTLLATYSLGFILSTATLLLSINTQSVYGLVLTVSLIVGLGPLLLVSIIRLAAPTEQLIKYGANAPVDIIITTYNEPVDLIEFTVAACVRLSGDTKVYVSDDDCICPA